MNELSIFNPPSNVATRDKTVPDLHLAEALGYERPTNIRALIKRHLPILEAMGSLHQREAMIEVGKGARRAVTEYHLNRAQTAFLVAKSGTKLADSLAVKMAEVFAMFAEGKLSVVDEQAQAELLDIESRERVRRLALHAEEKAARDGAFAIMRRR